MTQQIYKLTFSIHDPPLAALLFFRKNGLKIPFEWGNGNVLETEDGVTFHDTISIVKYLTQILDPAFYGQTIIEKGENDHFITLIASEFKYSNTFSNALKSLDSSLNNVVFFVGKGLSPSLADFVVFEFLYKNKSWQKILKEESGPINLTRWYNFFIAQNYVVSLFSELSKKNQSPEKPTRLNHTPQKMSTTSNIPKEEGKFVDLPGAVKGEVVVRFPPEASGYLHIGHAKAALLNQYYQLAFEGKLIMRFDDTNPAKEKEDFERVILEDVALLQIKPDKFSYSSDYFDLMIEKCIELIKLGNAYVDDTEPEIIKAQREQREESKNRNNSVEKNLAMWQEMVNGTEYGQKCCVRAKIDMKSDNGCMRDPAIYRCKNESHPRTVNKYKVYPIYDFACPIVDSIEGVTHALRTTEYHDRDDQYFWVLDKLKMRKPYIYEFSRLNMTNTVLSKRKLTWFVEQKLVDGWDDPRMPTVRGILRRGMTVEGLKQFIIAQGSSRSAVSMEWDKIWAFNKKVIDPIVARYTAVEKDNSIPVYIANAKEEKEEVPKHPKNSALGNKSLWKATKVLIDASDAKAVKEGDVVTFINWGNVLIKEIKKDANKNIQSISAELQHDNKDFKKTLKVTWLADTPQAPLVPCFFVFYDNLISKSNITKDEDFKDFISETTKVEVAMLGDPELKHLKKSEIVQILRKGYFICDQPYDASTSRHIGREAPLILIYVPDGSKEFATLPEKAKQMYRVKETPKEQIQQAKGKSSDKGSHAGQAGKGDASSSSKSIVTASYNSSININTDPINVQNLIDQIKLQGDKVRQMKAGNVPKSEIQPEIITLIKLKADYKSTTGKEWKLEVSNPSPPKSSSDSSPTKDLSESLHSTNDAVQLLDRQIKLQGDKVRHLKSNKIPKSELQPEIDNLLKLKGEYAIKTGKEWKPTVETASSTKDSSENLPATNDDIQILDMQIKLQGDKVREMKSNKVPKNELQPEIVNLLKLKGEYKIKTGKEWKPTVETASSTKDSSKDLPATNEAIQSLDMQIKLQGDKVRQMKSTKIPKSELKPEIDNLLKLKSEYKIMSGKEWKPTVEDASSINKKSAPLPESIQATKKTKQNESESKPALKKTTRLGMEAQKEENLSDWFSQVITKSEMLDYYDISGCYIYRPWTMKMWTKIVDYFTQKIEALGVEPCYFPMFVSSSCLEKEKTHISDFSPEVAWVTKSGSSDLMEPIAIRPTSETVMYPYYAKWIRSHRDLPLKLNQWCNVVRWEFKHPQPFLRTREFLWQEGHTAYANQEDAIEEVHTILGYYADIYEELLAVPVIRGRKTEKEKFAGGDFTTTVEAFISASGRAIQGGTSHHLGQNFSKMFEILFEDPETNEKKYVYQNSWGLTTRTLGVVVLVHGDNSGLVLPPKIACHQVVIVPCGITANSSEDDRKDLYVKCKEFETLLSTAGVRVHGDYRDNYSPGWKYNHWELKGVPIRVELGPRDITNKQFVAVRRDTSQKITQSQENAGLKINQLLDDIQANLFNRAKQDLDNHLTLAFTWDEFCQKLDSKCLIQAPFCGIVECEDKIKTDSARNADVEPGAPSMGAKALCIPFSQPQDITDTMKCIHPQCNAKPKYFAVFGRSY